MPVMNVHSTLYIIVLMKDLEKLIGEIYGISYKTNLIVYVFIFINLINILKNEKVINKRNRNISKNT